MAQKDSNTDTEDKSLGHLCSKFLDLYDRDGVETIGLDDAMSRLGAQSRRIYDLLNILIALGAVAKKSQKTYTWKGFGEAQNHLNELKVQNQVADDEEHEVEDEAEAGLARKEKPMPLIVEEFVKLFLCNPLPNEMISLQEAAKSLAGDGGSIPSMSRRVYDVVQVLASINLIEKVKHPTTKKSAFRWLGLEGRSKKPNSPPNLELSLGGSSVEGGRSVKGSHNHRELSLGVSIGATSQKGQCDDVDKLELTLGAPSQRKLKCFEAVDSEADGSDCDSEAAGNEADNPLNLNLSL